MRLVFKIERVAENPEEERILRKRKNSEEQLIKEESQVVFKRLVSLLYIFMILGIMFVLLMEIKNRYHTDVFDGLNFPFEDYYNGVTKGF